MSMPNKSKKGRADSAQMANKSVKAENKSESAKNIDKAQPTAEQMRIAQIIDTRQEDPALKDKIRQVMDATQKSEDEVCTALHDCDNDPDRAVNLLLEGGVKSEWSTSIKKKKRTPSDKNKESSPTVFPSPPQEELDWDANDDNDAVAVGKPTDVRGRPVRGIKNIRGQDRSWRGRENKENERNMDADRGRRGRMSNGPSRGRGGGGRGGRGFNRGRPPFRRSMDTWEVQPNSHDTSSSTLEDWDNEEYTGSLADSKVFTPSSNSDSTLPVPEAERSLPEERTPIQSGSPEEVPDRATCMYTSKYGNISLHQPLETLEFLKQFGAILPANVSSLPVKSTSVINKSVQLSKGLTQEHSRFSETDMEAAGYLPSFKGVDYQSNVKDEDTQPVFEDVRLPRVSNKMRARIPPPSKIPSSAVEMPPDAVGSGMALLDVQFGALDFGESPDSGQPPSTPTQRSPSPSSSEKLSSQQVSITGSDSLLMGDSSFSPVRSSGSTSVPPLSEMSTKNDDSSVSGSLYQESVYQTPQFTKTNQPTSFNSTYSNSVQVTSSSGYNSTSSSSAVPNNYSTTAVGNSYNNNYPQYPGYPNYPTPTQQLAITQLQSSSSYQSGVSNQYGGNQSVYGSSTALGSTSSYTAPYQTYSNSSHNSHKPLSSVSTNNKEFDTTSSVNINSMSQSNTINAAPSLLASTQTTSTTKQSSMSTMSKSAVVANMPSSVQPIVGTQYIMSQGGMPYFQPQLYSYEEVQMMSQQRIPHLQAGFYELGYQTSTTREGVQYNMSDARFARADNNTSPVQVTNINQQSGTQAHQQPLINPTAMPHAYAYFYGGSVLPGSFQYGAPTLYPVAATGTGSGHGSTNSGVYNKGPTTYTGGYGGTYEGGQSAATEYKSASQPKTQTPQSSNPPTSSDITMYTKSHAALSKVNSYDKQGFHCQTPPPFTLGSQNSGIGPAGGYTQQLFIPAMTPHHNTTLMHQPLHQDGSSSVSGRSQVGNQQNKVGPKTNYSSNYWPQN